MLLVDPLPGETLYSIAARYHLLSGYMRYKTTSQILFGSPKVRIHPYLPARVSAFSNALDISSSKLLAEHTLYRLFSTFLPSKADLLRRVMLEGDGGKVVHAAGLANFHLRFLEGHRFCPACVSEDEKAFGTGFYHIEHQVPGVSACYMHGVRLRVVRSGDFGIDRKLYLPPDNQHSEAAPVIDIQFAVYVVELMAAIVTGLEPSRSIYIGQLVRLGLAYETGRIKAMPIRESLADFFCSANWLCDAKTDKKIRDFKFIGAMLRNKTHYESHPVTHLLLGFWLANNRHLPVNSNLDSVVTAKSQCAKNSEARSAFLLGISLDLPRCYVESVLGFSLERAECEAVYCSDMKLTVFLSLALVGVHREEMALCLNRPTHQIDADISNIDGLAHWRRKLKIFIKTNQSRLAIEEYANGNDTCTRKDVRKALNNDFFQLYRHDRVALERLLPERSKPHDPHVDWSLRDRQTLERLKSFSREELTELSYGRIDLLLGGRGWLTKKRQKFTESIRFIQSAKQLEIA